MFEFFKVSIIIPAFNQGEFLDETLNSVYNQSFLNWECIIVNDGSNDNTEEIALNWCRKDSRFIYYKKENGGLSSARNFGIERANGNWIQLLDSDDLLEKNKLLYQMEIGLKTNSDILISGYRYFNNSEGINQLKLFGRNSILPNVHILEEDNSKEIIELLKYRNPFVISAPLYKKEVFLKVGLFDINLKSLEDWDFHLRCALAGIKFHHVGYNLCSKTLIRLHENSMMTNTSRMKDSIEYFYSKHKLEQNSDKVSNEDKRNVKAKVKGIVKLLTPPIVLNCLKFSWRISLNYKK